MQFNKIKNKIAVYPFWEADTVKYHSKNVWNIFKSFRSTNQLFNQL